MRISDLVLEPTTSRLQVHNVNQRFVQLRPFSTSTKSSSAGFKDAETAPRYAVLVFLILLRDKNTPGIQGLNYIAQFTAILYLNTVL